MCTWMYRCVNMHVECVLVRMDWYIYVHTNVFMYVRMSIHVCMLNVYRYVWICTCSYECLHSCIYKYSHDIVCMKVDMYIQGYVHKYYYYMC